MIGNIDAELHLIGAAMYAPEACETAFDRLTPDHFVEPVLGRVWSALKQMRGAGQSLDPTIIANRMGDDAAFAEFGGTRLLYDLLDKATPTAASDLTSMLCDLRVRRRLEELGRRTMADALNTASGTGEQLLHALERGAGEIAQDSISSDDWVSGSEVIQRAVKRARARAGKMEFVTGLKEVDDLIGGFNAGELALIAGRPGMAKSLVASQIAKANAERGVGVAFFSKEMNEEQLGLRLACDLAYREGEPIYSSQPHAGNPTYDAARKNLLDDDQWSRLDEASARIADWPLKFDTRPGLTISTIESCARRLVRNWERAGVKPGPVIIDHLGIIRPEKERQGSKVAETADISRGLAEMAKRLNVPVIALCQLNRAPEGRGEDKRPGLSDLRWAGELEQDARLVLFPFRPEYYYRPPLDPDAEDAEARAVRETKLRREKNRLYWIVAKNNNGPQGQVETFCDVSRAAIRDARR